MTPHVGGSDVTVTNKIPALGQWSSSEKCGGQGDSSHYSDDEPGHWMDTLLRLTFVTKTPDSQQQTNSKQLGLGLFT